MKILISLTNTPLHEFNKKKSWKKDTKTEKNTEQSILRGLKNGSIIIRC